MSSAECTALTKEAARALGFDACHIADATAPIDPEDRLGAWLGAGYHADMDWMARSKAVRQDLNQRLPGVQSVIVVARNYYRPRPQQPPGTGRVARYAWGRDYHRALRKPLRALAEALEAQLPDCACWCTIDSGPALERAWAARAGLGWVGKNSLVLLRDAWARVAAAGYTIGNVDATVVAQRPKLNPHVDAMRTTLAQTLEIGVEQVSVKPKTNEGVGPEGREEAIRAYAVVLLVPAAP